MSMAETLPIVEIREAVLEQWRRADAPTLLLRAPTGSGKSTQVPQWALDSGLLAEGQRAVVLQPRRLAARLLAQRVAQERGGRLGAEVGYQVRFDNVTSRQTRLVFATEGVLLRQLIEDPDLKGVGMLIIDEFHERHIDGDMVLAWARALKQERRPDLRVVVMSATLSAAALHEFMAPVVELESQGRMHPVELRYQPPLRDARTQQTEALWDQAARACEALDRELGPQGDILVFMPGAHEIRRTLSALQQRGLGRQRRLLALHGEMSPQDQDLAVAPSEAARIIVSTNVAETSLTIVGVRAVVDSGLARVANYDPRRGINTLTIQKISRSSAQQRSGRAGRTMAGIALRLWSQREQEQRAENELPEVARLDLSGVLLSVKVAEQKSGLELEWFEAPPDAAWQRARGLLHDLGALHEDNLTELGRRMARFPTHPRWARLLLAADHFGCVREAAACAALAQGREILMQGRSQSGGSNDEFWQPSDLTEFQALLRALERARAYDFSLDACARLGIHAAAAREASRSEEQFLQLAKREGLRLAEEVAHPEALARCLLEAFSDHLGVETSSGSRIYRLAGGYSGHLGRDAHIKPPRFLVASEIVEVQGKALSVNLNGVTAVQEEWLRAAFPEDFNVVLRAQYEAQGRRVLQVEETRFRQLVLQSRQRGEPDPAAAAEILAQQVVAGELQLPLWNERVEQWIARVNSLAQWMPQLELAAIGETDRHLMIHQLCEGCSTYRQLKDREVLPVVQQWLNREQRQALDFYAPERMDLPGGRSVQVVYAQDGPPSVSVILQHVYDWQANPRIAGGAVSVLVHLLSPARRPIQTTADLGRFWREGYPAVRSQLRGRYPKHEWR